MYVLLIIDATGAFQHGRVPAGAGEWIAYTHVCIYVYIYIYIYIYIYMCLYIYIYIYIHIYTYYIIYICNLIYTCIETAEDVDATVVGFNSRRRLPSERERWLPSEVCPSEMLPSRLLKVTCALCFFWRSARKFLPRRLFSGSCAKMHSPPLASHSLDFYISIRVYYKRPCTSSRQFLLMREVGR